MTASDLIAGSLRLLGVLGEAEVASASQLTDALSALNDMIDSWSNENLMIINSIRETFPLVANQQTYTIGTGGNFNTARPMEIKDALLQITDASPNVELGIEIVNQDQYDQIILKGTTSTIVRRLFYDNAYPLGNIWLYPVPQNGNYNLVLVSKKPLADVASASSTISLAPGFDRALRYNLAVEIAPEYAKEPSPTVAAIAIQSKAHVKRRATKIQLLGQDAAIVAKHSGFNWRTGGFT